jgi:hypothetical protein
MHARPARAVIVATSGAVLAALLVPPTTPANAAVVEAREIRSHSTAEFGLTRPAGIVYSPGEDALLVIGASRGARTPVLGLERAGDAKRPDRDIPTRLDGASAALDPTTGELTALDGTDKVTVSVTDAGPGRTGVQRSDVSDLGVGSDTASTFLPSGEWVLLDGAAGELVSVPQGDSTTLRQARRDPIRGTRTGSLTGLAYNPQDGRTYVADPDANRLYGLDESGTAAVTYDMIGVSLKDLRAMTFAPSADPTDGAAEQSLYLADAGDAQMTGRVIEMSLTAAAAALAADQTATLVRTINTSQWSPPSPDPAGITYRASTGELIITDSEVDEMPLYAGVNIWATSRTGVVNSRGTTLGFSNEPTGAGFHNGSTRLYVSDDDADRIFDIQRGPDLAFGTPDDIVAAYNTRSVDNRDNEDVDVDTSTGDLYTIDGVATDVFRYSSTGQFITRFDVGAFGARDPEGIAYDAERDHLFIVDDSSRAIYEVTKTGALINVIDISAANSVKAAGITLAPASNNSGARNFYIVDRGIDNDPQPNENDGKLYEMSTTLPPVGNAAPAVNAGVDQAVVLPGGISLDATVSDDGLPAPPGALTTTWSRVSGPGTVSFGSASSVDTTASFSAAGTYVLRLTAYDGELTSFDELTVEVEPAGSSQTLDIPIATGTDDAEQRPTGGMSLSSSDLELVDDGSNNQTVGLRFTALNVPKGSSVTNAFIQFQVDQASTGGASLTVHGQAADNPGTFTPTNGDMNARARTAASVGWVPATWPTVGARGPDQRTPNLATIVQQLVNRPGWASGNAMVFLVTGSGTRTAESIDGTRAPVLHLEFSGSGGGPTNQAPVVGAGIDRTITLPTNSVTLAGTVSDDGLPTGATVTSTWTQVGGTGVVFSDATSPTSTATFPAAGTYTLRLTASDTALQASDDMVVTVQPGGGGSQTLDVALNASSDDAEERDSSGKMSLNSSDLEITTTPSAVQTIGVRFTGVTVPKGATVTRAYIQFKVDEVDSIATNVTVYGQLSANPATFTTTARDVSSRPRTTGVAWAPPPWTTVGAAGPDQRTAELATVVQQVIGQSAWASGNAMAFVIQGTGTRVAEAFDGTGGTVLHIEYTS